MQKWEMTILVNARWPYTTAGTSSTYCYNCSEHYECNNLQFIEQKIKTHLHYNQHIQRVTVFTKCARNESIVVRVHNWWIQHTVHLHIQVQNQDILELRRQVCNNMGNKPHCITFISPVFLSSSYFTLLPLGISMTWQRNRTHFNESF